MLYLNQYKICLAELEQIPANVSKFVANLKMINLNFVNMHSTKIQTYFQVFT